MNIKRFWADLSIWNKYGLSFIMTVALLVLIYFLFL